MNQDTVVVSIDPGSSGSGVAVWVNNDLKRARFVEGAPEEQSINIRKELQNPCDILLIEYPQFYANRASKSIDHNDLIKLAYNVGRLEVLICAKKTMIISPRSWKGTVEKMAMIRRIMSKLTPEEQKCVELPANKRRQLDVIDAVGIGLKQIKRL